MQRVVPSHYSSSTGPTFYNPHLALLYIHYDMLNQAYQSWTLTEFKSMSHRERTYWLDLAKWRVARSNLGR